MATNGGYKPSKEFTAEAGDKSVGVRGPIAIQKDLLKLMAMFNPDDTITDPITEEVFRGGVGKNNIQNEFYDEIIQYINVKTYDGWSIDLGTITLYVGDVAPENPNENDIWIDTTKELL